MKSKLTLIAAFLGAASLLVAGPTDSGKSGKVVVTEPPATGCECFNGGWDLGAYGLYLSPDADTDETWGGGILAEYFFNRYVGLAGTAQWAEYEDTQVHNYALDAVFRYPIDSACIAPYAFIGGGVHCDGVTEAIGRLGVGLDWRIKDCYGLFVDYTYTLPGGGGGDDDLEDYQLIRLGMKFSF